MRHQTRHSGRNNAGSLTVALAVAIARALAALASCGGSGEDGMRRLAAVLCICGNIAAGMGILRARRRNADQG